MKSKKYISYINSMLTDYSWDAGCGLGEFDTDMKTDKEIDLNKRLLSKNSEFDTILCHHVLEHLDSPSSTLKEFHRVLKNNGRLVLIVPTIHSFTQEGHKWLLTKSVLSFLVGNAGFRIIEMYGFMGTDFFISENINRFIGKFYPTEIICIAKSFNIQKHK